MIDAVVARAQAGDSDAFTELYNKFKSKVSGQIYKMTRDSYRTEDLTQDVFITVFRKLPKFQGHSAFSTWLYRVAFNVVLMDVRSRKKRLQTVPIDDSTDSRPQSAFRTDSVLHLDMTRAIANLPGNISPARTCSETCTRTTREFFTHPWARRKASRQRAVRG
jgi:RNA polymerase sigma-70 factor (ECF subfamily)